MEGSGAAASGTRSVTPTKAREPRDAAYWSDVLAEERRAAIAREAARRAQQDIYIRAIGAVLMNRIAEAEAEAPVGHRQ